MAHPLTSEGLLRPPIPGIILGIFGVCFVCVACATGISVKLAAKHFRKGQELSGSMIPTRHAGIICNLVLSIPAFAIYSAFQLLTPESNLVWKFMMTLVTTHVMLKMPGLYINAVGGAPELERQIAQYNGENLKLYGTPPLCCIAPCVKPKMPSVMDIRKLKLGVLQFCFIQPTLAFIELFLEFERLNDVSWPNGLAWRKRVMLIFKLGSTLTAMSSCKGFGTLCGVADLKVASTLKSKANFVQSFLWAMNLIPLLGGLVLRGFVRQVVLRHDITFQKSDTSNWFHSAIVCVSSLYVARAAVKAFPLDDQTPHPDDLHHPLI